MNPRILLAALFSAAMPPSGGTFFGTPGGDGRTPKRNRNPGVRANRNRNKAQRKARKASR